MQHRVRNHFQIVASLLNLQASLTSAPATVKMLESMQLRVRAIANLYDSSFSIDDFSAMHFGQYVTNLTGELERAWAPSDRVQTQLSIADLAVDMEQALPLSLISNELVSNAFRHAFPGNRSGKVHVSVEYKSQDEAGELCRLEVSDDGVGLPQNVDPSTAVSMGFHMVRALTRQLRAKVEVDRSPGTSIRVSFSLAKG